MKKNILAIVVAAVIIPAAVYTGSPLFINTTIDEPLPVQNSAADKPVASTLANLPGSEIAYTIPKALQR